ncbi:hypothetical protein ARTHROSP310_17830 [Arthrobacter sp. AD-310]
MTAPLEEPKPKVHEGYEWLYVLNGSLRADARQGKARTPEVGGARPAVRFRSGP